MDGLLAEQRHTSSSNFGTILLQLKYIIDIWGFICLKKLLSLESTEGSLGVTSLTVSAIFDCLVQGLEMLMAPFH